MPFFQDISWSSYAAKDIILDIDGTLVSDSSVEISPATVQTVEQLKQRNRVYACSNSKNRIRNKQIADLLDVPLLDFCRRKPFREAIGERSDFNDILVIGDKWLTDGLLAVNLEAEFCKVDTVSDGRETLYIRLVNFFDALLGNIIVWIRKLF
jgi:predicted HAD superfamily phosphohydrolase YqeG